MFRGHITTDGNHNQIIHKSSFLIYNMVGKQYCDLEILEKIKSLIPEHIIQLNGENKIKSLLGWFKNDFMSWTPKDPTCKRCMDEGHGSPPMQVRAVSGSSWKLRAIEIHKCNQCSYEYSFPRYGQILKIAEARTGRCSEWSMLFGAIMNALRIEARIVHDFLDHCWDEAMINGKWVHIDSTLEYPISVDHPYYYEQNWGKKYEYVLAFSNDSVEDVTQRYTQNWDAVIKRREGKKPSFFRGLFLDF
jgi:peptide-N4-(N-acetyl-beta-glucosaminyl)asparagine amidase